MPVPRLMTSAHICRRSGGTARPKSVRSSGRLWFDPQPALHDGMKAGIVLDSADLQQHERSRALRRHDHVEIATSGGRGVCDHVVIDPFDGVADFGPRIGRPGAPDFPSGCGPFLHARGRRLQRLRARRRPAAQKIPAKHARELADAALQVGDELRGNEPSRLYYHNRYPNSRRGRRRLASWRAMVVQTLS